MRTNLYKGFLLILMACFFSACQNMPLRKSGIGKAISYDQLSGWSTDNHLEVLPALLAQCPLLSAKNQDWQYICHNASELENTTNDEARLFFETHFDAHEIISEHGTSNGLITGYYTPSLRGSFTKSEQYHYPLYAKPKELLHINLSENDKKARVRGRLTEHTVIPFYSREEIDSPELPLAGQEILWIDNADDGFFLHVQGSGVVLMDDGQWVSVAYADVNGRSYRSIGKILIEQGEIAKENISLQSIAQWLKENTQKAEWLKNQNESYVFFHLKDDGALEQPHGSLGIALTPERSIAVDREIIPLGTVVWLDSHLHDNTPYQRLMMAQDTGGAIKGAIRADVFWGRGDKAKIHAGNMKSTGKLYALLPKSLKHD